ncbi:hypothetical protein [Amycolatopsis sp. NPDC004169]|uniref:hypothetical protein n=1 Tax=Amycolatopsis sp. NPDC004169 TaxID=3154453 RepID=UPI0033BBDA17
MNRRSEDATPGYEDNAALRGFGGYEPADAPRAQPKRIRPKAKPLKWRRAPWFGLVFIALVAGVLNAFGIGKPRPASSSPPPSPLVVTPSPRATVPPAVAGWRSVAGGDGAYAYDVPPNWEPAPGTQHGWDGIRLITSAFLGKCDGGAGITTEPLADLEAAARKAATDLASGAYGAAPEIGPGSDAQVARADGTPVPARVVVASVTPVPTGECAVRQAQLAVLAFGEDSGTSGVVVAYGTSARDELERIVRSYRFVPAADRGVTTPPPTTVR